MTGKLPQGGKAMEDLAVFWRVLLSIAAGITTVGGAVAIIYKFKKPFDKLKENINILYRQNETQDSYVKEIRRDIDDEFKRADRTHEEKEREMRLYVDGKCMNTANALSDMQKQVEQVEKAMSCNQQDMQLILSSLYSISNHLITGNSIDKLKDTNEKIFNHLVQKSGLIDSFTKF